MRLTTNKSAPVLPGNVPCKAPKTRLPAPKTRCKAPKNSSAGAKNSARGATNSSTGAKKSFVGRQKLVAASLIGGVLPGNAPPGGCSSWERSSRGVFFLGTFLPGGVLPGNVPRCYRGALARGNPQSAYSLRRAQGLRGADEFLAGLGADPRR